MQAEDAVRAHVYRATVAWGRPPRVDEVAAALALAPEEVRDAFARLRARRLLFLAPESGEIVMAPPFSAVPTGFTVDTGGRRYFANCVWDSLGIAAALHADAVVEASCACCGEPMRLHVEDGRVRAETAIEDAAATEKARAHFAVPAAHWWDDLVYT
jgi:hypothetical protein